MVVAVALQGDDNDLGGGGFQDVEDALKRGVIKEGDLASNEAGRRCLDEITDAGGCDARF